VEEIKLALLAVQPFFDKLNGEVSSKEVLTEDEYVQYIEAQMTYEKIIVQSGIDPSKGEVKVEMILPHLQKEFLESSKIMGAVSEKQLGK